MIESSTIFVVDASVAVKWLLPLDEEPHAELALRVLQDARDGRSSLVSPSHLSYEVDSALVKAVRNKDRVVTLAQGFEALRTFQQLGYPVLYDEDHVKTSAWELAHQFGCSFYDATYLALSSDLGWPLIHADDALRRKLSGRFAHEMWIEDYVIA